MKPAAEVRAKCNALEARALASTDAEDRSHLAATITGLRWALDDPIDLAAFMILCDGSNLLADLRKKVGT